MDEPIKEMVTMFILFLCSFFMITILTFGIVAQNARNALYTVVDYIEIKGYDAQVINDYADKTNLTINVEPSGNSGIGDDGGKNRYLVTVSFSHVLAWLNSTHSISYQAMTKAVDY